MFHHIIMISHHPQGLEMQTWSKEFYNNQKQERQMIFFSNSTWVLHKIIYFYPNPIIINMRLCCHVADHHISSILTLQWKQLDIQLLKEIICWHQWNNNMYYLIEFWWLWNFTPTLATRTQTIHIVKKHLQG